MFHDNEMDKISEFGLREVRETAIFINKPRHFFSNLSLDTNFSFQPKAEKISQNFLFFCS